jgi:hypothetical protein
MPFSDLGARGSVILKKLAGSGILAVGTEILIPTAMVQPVNPKNNSYPGAINATDNESLKLLGNQTPAVSIRTFAKSSFLTANLLNSLLFSADAAGNTDKYAIQIKSQFRTRQYNLCRCAQIVEQQSASGGAVILDLAFAAIYGDSDSNDPSPATFTTTPAPDGGSLIDKSQVKWNSTADQVKGHTLTLSRVQAPQFSDNGTLYAEEIASGPFSGSLMLTQSDTATTIPGSACTIQIGSAGAGVQFALNLNLDAPFTPQDFGFVMHNSGYKLFNSGTVPVVITAL